MAPKRKKGDAPKKISKRHRSSTPTDAAPVDDADSTQHYVLEEIQGPSPPVAVPIEMEEIVLQEPVVQEPNLPTMEPVLTTLNTITVVATVEASQEPDTSDISSIHSGTEPETAVQKKKKKTKTRKPAASKDKPISWPDAVETYIAVWYAAHPQFWDKENPMYANKAKKTGFLQELVDDITAKFQVECTRKYKISYIYLVSFYSLNLVL